MSVDSIETFTISITPGTCKCFVCGALTVHSDLMNVIRHDPRLSLSACDDVIRRQMKLLCIYFSSDCVKQENSAYATTIGVLKLKRLLCFT